jgi:O-acetylserine/cysteine efflux transporter
MAVAFVGVYLLAGEPAARPSPVHFLFVVGGAFAWSVANILIKRLGPIGVFSLNGWLAWLAWPQLLIVSVVVESGHRGALINADWTAWAAIAYMALGASITAYGLWYHLVRRHEINRIVPLTLLSPVLAVALAVVLLDEAFTARIAGGGVVTLLGVAMILFLRPRPVVAGAPVSSP